MSDDLFPDKATLKQKMEEFIQMKLELFFQNNQERIQQWKEAHAKDSAKLPIYWSPEHECWLWANRSQRRQK